MFNSPPLGTHKAVDAAVAKMRTPVSIPLFSIVLLVALFSNAAVSVTPVPRAVRVDGQRFVVAATNETVVMAGPNIVVYVHV